MDRFCRNRLPLALPAVALALLACSGGGGGTSSPPPGACPEVAALEVVSSTPADGQRGVSVGAAISVRFNTCVDPGSLTPGAVALRRGVTAVPGGLSWDAEQVALVFVPDAPLAFGVEYSFSVAGLRGAHGEPLVPALVVFRTRLAPETVPPVTTAAPPAGRYNTPQSVVLACDDGPSGTGCVDTFFTLDGSAPTPASPRYLAPIAVDRSLAIRFFSVDGDGNAEAPQTAEYVLDTDPPGVEATEPEPGETGVRLDAPIRIVFDEEMDAGTLAAVPSVTPVAPGAPAAEPGGRAVLRRPGERYECGTTYEVTVPATAADLAGNALPEPFTFTFTTSSDCDEPRTSASLASGAYAAAQAVTLSCDDGEGGSGCARIAYTLDGSVPSFDPPNGVVVAGASAGPIAIGAGETVLRFRGEDAAGHLEVVRERRYSVSTEGFTWLATAWGLARGAGLVPERFVPVRSSGPTRQISRDAASGRLYRVTESGIVFSDDGAGFQPLPVAFEGSASLVSPTAFAAQGSRLYVGTSSGLLVSTDGGASFQERHFGGYEADRIRRIAVSGTDVYVATDLALHVSHDRFRTSEPRPGRLADLAVDGGTVYAAGRPESGVAVGALFVSRDRGASWSVTALPPGAGDAHAVAFQGDHVYVGTDGGVAVSTDRGATFAALVALDGYEVTRVAAGDGHVYAASGDPFSSAASAFWVAASPAGPFERRQVAGGTRDVRVSGITVEGAEVHLGAYPSYWVSRDHGATFALADLPGDDAHRVIAQGAKVWAAIHDSAGWGGIVVSDDHGATFTYRGPESGLPDDSVDDLFLDGATLYAATWRGLAITADDGATWDVRTEASSGLWQSSAGAVAASGGTIWVGAVTKLQRSTDGGASFSDVPLGVWVTPRELAASGEGVYLGTSAGVWASTDGGATFARRTAAHGLADDSVDDLDLLPDGTLVVATAGGLDASADGGATFQPVTLPASVTPSAVSACGGVLWVGGSAAGVSTDGGATFAVRAAADGVPGRLQDACYAAP